MKERYTRRMTFNERAFVVLDLICPPMANQFIFDGEGILDIEKWRIAVDIASEANPGTRLILSGHLSWSRWIDSGITPRIREVDGSQWDGMSPEDAPFFRRIFPIERVPPARLF